MDEQGRVDAALNLQFLTCAVRALMASHPQPDLLRAEWDREMAAMWPDALKVFHGQNPVADQMRHKQQIWESLIPESPAR